MLQRSRFLPIVVCVALAVLFAAAPAAAAPDFAAARQFLLDGVARAGVLLKEHDAPRAEVAEKLRAEFRRRFDMPAIAGFALGPAGRGATPDQRRRYLRAFEELIVQTYTSHVVRVGPLVERDIGDIVRVTGSTPLGADELLLHSEINRRNAKWVKIDWRLRERQGRFRIVDIVILGISQAQVYRAEFASVMSREGTGIDGLIRALAEKSDALRGAARASSR